MRKLLEDKELIAAAPNSEEKRNIGTSFGKRESTALQDQTVEQVPVQGLQDEAQRDSGKTGQRTTENGPTSGQEEPSITNPHHRSLVDKFPSDVQRKEQGH